MSGSIPNGTALTIFENPEAIDQPPVHGARPAGLSLLQTTMLNG
jgi:hypothetical protein